MMAGADRSRHRLWLWGAAGLPIGWLVQRLAAAFPETTERAFTQTLFPPIRRSCQWLAGLLPISLAEFLIIASGALALGMTVRGLRRVAQGRAGWRETVAAGLRRTAATAGCAYVLFLATWGLNYARPPLAARLGLELHETDTHELVALCAELRDQCRIERAGRAEDAEGFFELEADTGELASNVGAAMRAASGRHPAWAGLGGPDPLLRFPFLSPLLSRFGITGVWSPWTAEAHVNDHVPDVLKPFTACHEAAHGRGFAREDEANFVAYVVGRRAPSPDMRYSASLCALRSALGQLARVEVDMARRVTEKLDAGTACDMRALDAYWITQRGWIMGVARQANDLYLRTQGDARGVQSYGRMVDLLLAERRMRGSRL